jgi:hypothetical protein
MSVHINVRFPDELMSKIDHVAKREGMTDGNHHQLALDCAGPSRRCRGTINSPSTQEGTQAHQAGRGCHPDSDTFTPSSIQPADASRHPIHPAASCNQLQMHRLPRQTRVTIPVQPGPDLNKDHPEPGSHPISAQTQRPDQSQTLIRKRQSPRPPAFPRR